MPKKRVLDMALLHKARRLCKERGLSRTATEVSLDKLEKAHARRAHHLQQHIRFSMSRQNKGFAL